MTARRFVGDVGGVRITDDTITIPPTPPPDIDVEKWQDSIELIRGWAPTRLAMTHFGASHDVARQLDELSDRLGRWAELARDQDQDGFIAAIQHEIAASASPEVAEAYTQAAPPEQLYAGLERYWRKRDERAGRADSAPVS